MGIRRIENTDPAFEQFLKLPELIDAASRWLVEQGGCTAVRGPCSPLPDFFNLGILVEGFDQPQVTGEADNPAYYPALIEGCGFEKENLRDNMTNKELVMSMLAELSTKEISEVVNPQSFAEHKDVARRGGGVAKEAKHKLEAETGKKVVTSQNAKQLHLPKKSDQDE